MRVGNSSSLAHAPRPPEDYKAFPCNNCTDSTGINYLILWLVIIRQRIGKVFPAPIPLVDPASLLQEKTVGLYDDGVQQVNIRDLYTYIQRQAKLFEVPGFRRFFGVGIAGF